jgi:DNA topoisomerase-2
MSNNETNFAILSDAEHIRLRAGLYAGSITLQETRVYEDGSFKNLQLNEALLKIINEIIDNSCDEAIRTNFKFANKIDVTVTSNTVTVKDNGRGIPVKLIENTDGSKIYQPVAAWSKARAGSNFDDSKREGMGTNGIGSLLTNCLSNEFIGVTEDSSSKLTFVANRGETVSVDVTKTIKNGTSVTFKPDLEFFGLTQIDDTHISVINERIKSLSVAFPNVKFTFNGNLVKIKSPEEYYSPLVSVRTPNGSWFGLVKSTGSFETNSIVNGLIVPNGGSHIDVFMSGAMSSLSGLIKKRKKVDITPAKLKSYLQCFSVIGGFKALKFDSQTKTKITNSISEVKSHLGDIDFDKVAMQLFKSEDLISDIMAFTKFQEDLEAKKAMDKLDKPKKKFISDKFISSVGEMKTLFITEGLSASGGLSPAIGRSGVAYYALKGVPMNSWDCRPQDFTSNVELSELYTLIKNNPDIDIVIACDADLDGIKITALLFAFFKRHFSELYDKKRIKVINTPIACVLDKKDVPSKWAYTFSDIHNLKGTISYKKGLGSWSSDQLKHIISADGLSSMVVSVDSPSDELLNDWFLGSNADIRKDRIRSVPAFNINYL